jgi:hypothetical protein
VFELAPRGAAFALIDFVGAASDVTADPWLRGLFPAGARPSRVAGGLQKHKAASFGHASGSTHHRRLSKSWSAPSAAGYPELVDDLLQMAEVEWEHEQYFRRKVANHWLCRVFKLWPDPPPKPQIRHGHTNLKLSGWKAE